MDGLTELLLVACAALFALRVLGQLLVVVARPGWLPPMEGWQSGLLPYPVLLASQVALLVGQGVVITDVADGARGSDAAGVVLLVLAAAYALGMAWRARLRNRRRWPHWWSHGTIPIVFHLVLATFLAAWGVAVLSDR